jgi:hypothetical protein
MKKILMVVMMMALVGCSTEKTTKVVWDSSGYVIHVGGPVECEMNVAPVPSQPTDTPAVAEVPAVETPAVVPEVAPVTVVAGSADTLSFIDAEGKALEKELYEPLPKWAVICVTIVGLLCIPLLVIITSLWFSVVNRYKAMRSYYDN